MLRSQASDASDFETAASRYALIEKLGKDDVKAIDVLRSHFISKKGNLQRRGRHWPHVWLNQFVILSEDSVKMYESEKHWKENREPGIEVTLCTTCKLAKSLKKVHTFELSSGLEHLSLKASSEVECEEWVNSIRRNVQVVESFERYFLESRGAVPGATIISEASPAGRESSYSTETAIADRRSWKLSRPIATTLEKEIQKSANILAKFLNPALSPEHRIPPKIFAAAQGLVFLTMLKAGFMVGGSLGTGLVIAKTPSGGWSAPSAIMSSSLSFGLQGGAEISEFMIVLMTKSAVKNFASLGSVAVGAGLDLTVGPMGSGSGFNLNAGTGGVVPNFVYSLGKGIFGGVSLQGALIATRPNVNEKFYSQKIDVIKLLDGSVPPVPAAAPIYRLLAMSDGTAATVKELGGDASTSVTSTPAPIGLATTEILDLETPPFDEEDFKSFVAEGQLPPPSKPLELFSTSDSVTVYWHWLGRDVNLESNTHVMFCIEWKLAKNENWVPMRFPVSATVAKKTMLSPDHDYQFRIKAEASGLSSDWSPPSNIIKTRSVRESLAGWIGNTSLNNLPAGEEREGLLPHPPGNLRVASMDSHSMTMEWDEPAYKGKNCRDVWSYRIQWKKLVELCWSVDTTSKTRFRITGLTQGEQYHVVVMTRTATGYSLGTESDVIEIPREPGMSDGNHKSSNYLVDWLDIDPDKDIFYDHPKQILGKGGYGIVFKTAVGGFRGRTAAVKMLHANLSGDSDAMKDMRTEVALLSTLQHPHLIELLGACLRPNGFLVITEFCDSGSLFDAIHKNKTMLTQQEKAVALYESAMALAYLHNQTPPVIHRDIKPQNILLCALDKPIYGSRFTVKLADFGMARAREFSCLQTSVGGTFAYLSPESFRVDSPITEKTDLYSFALTMLETFTAETPWKNFAPHQVTYMVAVKGARPHIPSSLHGEIANLVVWCWQNDPVQRPSFDEVVEILHDYLERYYGIQRTP